MKASTGGADGATSGQRGRRLLRAAVLAAAGAAVSAVALALAGAYRSRAEVAEIRTRIALWRLDELETRLDPLVESEPDRALLRALFASLRARAERGALDPEDLEALRHRADAIGADLAVTSEEATSFREAALRPR